jgi:serine/threonine-protein kinase
MQLNSLNTHCNETVLLRYLDQELPAADELEVEKHVEDCESCRHRLHRAAASQSAWSDASRLLKADEFDGKASILCDPWLTHQIKAERSASALALRETKRWLDSSDDPRMLGRFGGYEILGIVGEGGMGIVLKGFETSLNRYVAIKILAPHLATSGAARQRFAREAQAAAAVLHENVISIHRVAESHDLPYLVMPYIGGESLQRRLDHEGPLSLTAVLRISRQIAAGLAAAHAQGLVHRDVKPANILLDRGVDRVTITDFGLARAVDDCSVTRTGMIAGTPHYMSPEQSRGETVDGRSDLFSIGSVMYAMCTGYPPFRAETSYGVLRRITDDRPRPIREINSAVPDSRKSVV